AAFTCLLARWRGHAGGVSAKSAWCPWGGSGGRPRGNRGDTPRVAALTGDPPMTLHRILLVALAVAASAPAQCGNGNLATIFAANNGGSNGWGVYFDVNITHPFGINVCGFDTNTGT